MKTDAPDTLAEQGLLDDSLKALLADAKKHIAKPENPVPEKHRRILWRWVRMTWRMSVKGGVYSKRLLRVEVSLFSPSLPPKSEASFRDVSVSGWLSRLFPRLFP